MNRNALSLLLFPFILVAGLQGCSRVTTQEIAPQQRSDTPFLIQGSLLIARPLPLPALLGGSSSQQLNAFGFAPGALPPRMLSTSSPTLKISRADKKIELWNGEALILSLPGDGIENLKSGTFRVILKQKNPLWYAPTRYFEQRALVVPSEGDKARFLRGALGEYVLYFDKESTLHGGPLWSDEIGGVKVEEAALSKLYYLLSVGSEVVVD